ncbi:MAG: hypothetical protein AB7S78_04820, partial [Candidatus Omnitrophota bacterium]
MARRWALILFSGLVFLTGSRSAEATTYNFVGVTTANDGVSPNPIAEEHDSDQFPWDAAGHVNDTATPSDAEYVNISADNTSQWVSDDPGAGDYLPIEFKFFIESPDILTNINLLWNGNTDDANNIAHSIWVLADGTSETTASNWTQIGGTTSINQDVDTDVSRDIAASFSTYVNATTGLIEWVLFPNKTSSDVRTNYVQVVTSTAVDISGTTNLGNGVTVRVAVNNTLQAQTGTTSGGTWTISGVVDIPQNATITVWADGV